MKEIGYELLFEAHPHPMWIYDQETLRFLSVNNAAIARYGYTREEFLAMRITDIRPPADLERLQAAIASRARHAKWWHGGTWRHCLKSGEVIHVDIASHAVTLDDRPAALVVAHDVTERVRADAQAKLLASIVENSRDAIISSANGIILSWNEGAARLFGYTPEEAIGQSVFLFISAERKREFESLSSRMYRGERIAHFETERQRKDGSLVPVALTLAPIYDEGGQVVAISSITHDLTALRDATSALRISEERLRFALSAAQVGVWEANLATNVSYWSETCEAIHGLAPGTFGKSFEAFVACIHPDDRADVIAAIQSASSDHQTAEMEYRTVWPDGTQRWIRSRAQFSYNEAGAPLRGAGVSVDVTERRSLEARLAQSQKMEAIGQLAGGVAHDFNNILTAILGNADWILDDLPEDDEHRINAEEIRDAGRRAAALTHQLLAFSRRQIVAPKVLHLGEVIANIMPMLRRLLGESINLKEVLQDRGRVKADVVQVEQILMNLAVNARDAMPDGGLLTIESADVVLDVEYARQHTHIQPGPHVMVAVSDTGHGIDAATQKRLFEPFFTTKPKGRGTGLGLATVYGAVKQAGGHILVHSEVGQGSTFKVYLPRTTEESVAERDVSVSGDRHSLSGCETVVLVENQVAVRRFAHAALSERGYNVNSFADPEQALDFAHDASATLDLIVTDLVLPGMNGCAMTARIRQRHPEVRVLYMSGYADEAVVRSGVLEPGTRFLQKPFNGDTLARSVRDALGQAARRRPRAARRHDSVNWMPS